MSSQTQVENVQQQIEGAAQEVSEVKASLSAAKHAGDGDEVNFLRIQLEQLYKKEVALREKENLLLRAQQGVAGEHEEYNMGAPLYSFFLVDAFSMRAPYEQYGLYLASLTGGAFMANSFFKAFNLAKYVKYSQQQGFEKEAQYAADMAQVHPHELSPTCPLQELERAGRTVAKLRARGVATALAFPALWIAWRLLSHAPQKQLKDSHDITKRIEPICIADGKTITLPYTIAGTS
ncbi:TPA: hypothetical protein ACH3X1_000718 [Trebouxia sp. C0004]